MRTLRAVYEWLRVPIRANHSLKRALRTPYVHLTCALHSVYEWLRVPTTTNHSIMHALCAPMHVP